MCRACPERRRVWVKFHMAESLERQRDSVGCGILAFAPASLELGVSALEMWRTNFVIRAENLNIPRSLTLFFVLLFLTLSSAWGIDPNKLISQYAHTAWRTQDGAFSGSPIVITQTTDGYLWIGTNIGLVRFDGVRFASWNPPPGTRLLDSRIFSLLGTHDGSLWIGTGFSISRWKDRELISYPELSGRIESIVEDDDGSVWLVRTQATDKTGPLCRVKDRGFRCYGVSDGIPFPLAIQLSKGSSGELWVGGYSELCRWKPGSCNSYFANDSRRPETFASIRGIATGANGSVWAVIDRSRRVLELEQFEQGSWVTRSFPQITTNNSDVTALFVDNETLWIGTANHGVFRIRGEKVDHFGSADGLSGDAVLRFYRDAEGILWIVTSGGIDNLRDLKVVSYSMKEGLSAAGASSVLAAPDATVWIGNYRALDFLRAGKLFAIRAAQGLPGRNVTTMFQDHAGQLWLGVDGGLWIYDSGKFRAVRHSDGSPLGIVFAITEDVQHRIWVRAGPHLDEINDQIRDEIHEARVVNEFTSPQISTAYTLASDPRGGIFLGLVNGDLVHYQDDKTQTIPSNEAGNRRQIRDLLVESDGSVWGTTLDELARWKDGTRKNLTTRNGLPCDGIFALVQDNRSTLWLYSRCGLIAIEKAELYSWWEHPDRVVNFKLFDAFDGVQPGLTSLKPQATGSPDGRLWFVNGQILQTLDPDHLQENLRPPPVEVEEIVADRKSYAPQKSLRLPPLTRDLEIRYTGLSFVAPEKVRFRYKLEGRDAGWQEPGTRRQAFYSDLPPGKYTFRLVACNNDGIWNESGTTLEFSIAPAWYQTIWFRLLCAVCCLFIAWALYRLRVRQIARAISARFDERLAERTRMARDLHDTFLQTIQGSKLVADDALDPSADPARMRRAMEQLSVWLEQAMREGRAALNSLRTSTTQRNDLADAFRRAAENGRLPGSMEAVLSVVGEARDMHPIVRDEVYRIGYEAIRNAYLHSHAGRLEVELRYAQDLTVRVRDNGVGIEPAVRDEGKAGHFGLRGMRERAARIGAQLTIASSAGTGTEVTVVVPGRIVFRKAKKSSSGKSKGRL
jgi:signal transduction histidine kinase/ligand-binding sensor domain-containing protein